MKQSDIVSVVLIALIGTLAAYFMVQLLLPAPEDNPVTFKTVEVVDSKLQEPNPEVFSERAINPTVEVYVGACEDVDQNGILSEAERANCGQIKSPDEEGEGSAEEEGQ